MLVRRRSKNLENSVLHVELTVTRLLLIHLYIVDMRHCSLRDIARYSV